MSDEHDSEIAKISEIETDIHEVCSTFALEIAKISDLKTLFLLRISFISLILAISESKLSVLHEIGYVSLILAISDCTSSSTF